MGAVQIASRVGVTILATVAMVQVLGQPASAVKIEVPPGAKPYSPQLATRLGAAVAEKGAGYEPRTRHRNPDGSAKFTNRLILESSPYLLQHAHNPVNWRPWGDEAFAEARRTGKPVLLSVGYSTCHWCHVMEEESFEDIEIATYLNEHYVAVKVDRERRPDVDGVYMQAVQLMTRRGGWPMTVWLTPERKPFYGGTYFPPRDGVRGSRVGFLTLLERLQSEYQLRPETVASAAENIARRVEQSMASAGGDSLPSAVNLKRAYSQIAPSFDETRGGFGGAPKFPRSVQLEFLLRYHRRSGDPEARRMALRTLEAMAAGGMYDQIGGGFHRYSTDANWLVPHFEKMLYDNALLVVAYLEAYQVSANPDFARVARETLDYVVREMTSPEGAFYSATDADSEGEEGTFFVWTPAQIDAVLPPARARLVKAYYGVTKQGNFEGKSILHVSRPLAEVASGLGIDPATAESELAAARTALYEARRKRPPPLTDHKILPSWNGLMISAFARAAQVLGAPQYAEKAARAADFLLGSMMRGDRLARSSLDGKLGGSAYLDDYAFLTAGLLDLYEATFDVRWLRHAIALQKTADEYFWDGKTGGYFLTADDHEALLAREKPDYDGAEPSGNSVALLNLLRLYELTGQDRYRQRAEDGLQAFENTLNSRPSSVPRMLGAVDFWLDRSKEIVIVTPNRVEEAEPFLARLRATYLPNRIVAVASEGDALRELATLVPLVGEKQARGGLTTAYVCERRVCDLPTSDPAVFAKQIARVEPLE